MCPTKIYKKKKILKNNEKGKTLVEKIGVFLIERKKITSPLSPAMITRKQSICTVCTRRIRWSCEGPTSISQQIYWIWLKHLLLMTMYNLLLPKLMCYSTTGCLCPCNSGSTLRLTLKYWLRNTDSGAVLYPAKIAFMYLLGPFRMRTARLDRAYNFKIFTILCPFFSVDHIVMDLSVRMNNKDFVSRNFTFFDCSLHNA